MKTFFEILELINANVLLKKELNNYNDFDIDESIDFKNYTNLYKDKQSFNIDGNISNINDFD